MTDVLLPPTSVTVDQLPLKVPQEPFVSPIASRSTVNVDAFGPEPPVSVTLPSDTGTDNAV